MTDQELPVSEGLQQGSWLHSDHPRTAEGHFSWLMVLLFWSPATEQQLDPTTGAAASGNSRALEKVFVLCK